MREERKVRGEPGVPAGPGRPLAVAAALVVGSAVAAAAGRMQPEPPVVIRGEPPEPPAGGGEEVPPGAAALLRIVAWLGSGDPVERRETANVVERLARDPDPAVRRALAGALAALGGEPARLPLSLLAADPDPEVRTLARRALLDRLGGAGTSRVGM